MNVRWGVVGKIATFTFVAAAAIGGHALEPHASAAMPRRLQCVDHATLILPAAAQDVSACLTGIPQPHVVINDPQSRTENV